MKKLFAILAAVLFGVCVFAQPQDYISYQAVIRDANNQLITNQTIGIQISILQGSVGGSELYVEKHFPVANTNGLISLEIGDGLVVSGNYALIDWSDGPYFLKTETDPGGGVNYTITGTNQLLSVPYALHAKTAETLVGEVEYTETDPTVPQYVKDIESGDIDNWNEAYDWGDHSEVGYLTEENQSLADVLSQGNNADGNQIKNLSDPTQAQDAATKAYVDEITPATYEIGDFVHGGIVFWVDATGQHGLVCAKADQSTGVRWHAGEYTWTMALGDGPMAGKLNTAIIIAGQGNGDGNTYAARICNELQVTEGGKMYGDWYLPSKEELNLMYQNKAFIDATAGSNGGSSLADASYWSSGEANNNFTWSQNLTTGIQEGDIKGNSRRVRAVRSF